MHSLATVLTTLIWGGKAEADSLEAAAYQVIETCIDLAGYTAERKADLYALIAEAVSPTDSFASMQTLINDCLIMNEMEFLRG